MAPLRRRRTGRRAVGLLVGLLVLGVVLGGLAQAAERGTVVAGWDARAGVWAASEVGPTEAAVLRVVTHAGDTATIVALSVVVMALLSWGGHRRLALFLATVVVGQWVIVNAAKHLAQRARPDLDPLTSFSGFSYPSGHAAAASSTYLALAIIVIALRPAWWRPVVVAGAGAVAVAVAASRVLLGVHWTSDVVGGLVLGWTWCLLCAGAYDLLRPRPAPAGSTSTTTSSPSAT